MESRGRCDVKDKSRLKVRSKSAASLKNSPYYERFLFFEKISSSSGSRCKERSTPQRNSDVDCRNDIIVAQSTRQNSLAKTETVPESRNGSNRDEHTSNRYSSRRDKHLRKSREDSKVERSRATHLNFAYGRVSVGECPEDAVSNSFRLPETPLRQRHSSEPRHDKSQRLGVGRPDNVQTEMERTSDTLDDCDNMKFTCLHNCGSEKIFKDHSLKGSQITNTDSMVLASLMVNETYSRRCHSSPDMTLITPKLKISPSFDDFIPGDPSSPDSQFKTVNESHSQCSGELFQSRSVSPADFFYSASVYPSLMTTCSSPKSEPTPTQRMFRDPSELCGQRSEASIHLTSSCNNLALPKETTRRIHVIKTAHSAPSLPVESSPRLVDDWLTSVLRLREDTPETWIYPEDEQGPCVFMPDNAGDADNFETGSDQVGTCDREEMIKAPSHENSTQEDKQWSTTGTNTDISIQSTEIFTNHDNGAELFFNHNDQPTRCPTCSLGAIAIDSPYDKCCSYCCLHHKNKQCSQVHFSHIYHHGLSGLDDLQEAGFNAEITSNDRSLNLASRHLYGTSEYTPDLSHKSEITICISGEDEVGKSSLSTKLSEDIERSLSLKDSLKELRASPHYIFPSSRPMYEENISSLVPQLSPRNSIGSICSIQSFRSSNADSAVDLGPPDDDHDFEFADFLNQHQSRRYSSRSDNGETADVDQQGESSYNSSEKCSIALNLTHSFIRQWPLHSGIMNRIEPQCISAHVISPQSVKAYCEKTFFAFDPQVKIDDSFESKLSLSKEAHSSGFRLYESVSKSSRDSLESNTDNQTNMTADTSSDIYLHSKRSISESTDTKSEPQPSNRFVHNTNAGFSPTKLRHEVLIPENLLHNIPELVISDHSETDHPMLNNEQGSLDEAEIELESIGSGSRFSPIAPSPTPSSDSDLLQVEGHCGFRSPSVSSVCSDVSTCSTCTIYSDSDVEKPRKDVLNIDLRLLDADCRTREEDSSHGIKILEKDPKVHDSLRRIVSSLGQLEGQYSHGTRRSFNNSMREFAELGHSVQDSK
ncbi:hypothetical protein Bpfe_015760 [Biomphalaria pfeifferi]|uniref:Uncharacterized protein n=1 Tax=Biomphalaria pfeifferi TaxID=112525 RepID=A0AAD8BHX2_BIOPF|nr:hypothetical protein Bpfe_015760 [Biomphalaria pfeifferi]